MSALCVFPSKPGVPAPPAFSSRGTHGTVCVGKIASCSLLHFVDHSLYVILHFSLLALPVKVAGVPHLIR